MADVTRKDKLQSAQALIDGGVGLVSMLDSGVDLEERRFGAGAGVISIAMGLAGLRGWRSLQWGGVIATVGWLQRSARAARRNDRDPAIAVDEARETGTLEERRAALEERREALLTAATTRRVQRATTWSGKLAAGRLMASGVIGLVMAADPTAKPHQRRLGVAGGALAITGGVGQLRRSERTHVVVMGGYALLFTATGVGAILRRVRRR